MRARAFSLSVVGAVFVAATITLQILAPGLSPAEAEGFNFVCSATGEPEDGDPGPGEFEQLRNAFAVSLTSGNNYFRFRGLAPPGVPVAGGGEVDPVTGGTFFERRLTPARLGENQYVDFLDEDDVPGSVGPEVDIGLDLRSLAGSGLDDLGVRRLLTDNFGVPNDDPLGLDISLIGIDVDMDMNAAMTGLPSGFKGSFESYFGFNLADGTQQVGFVRIGLDSLQPNARVPDDVSLGIALKQPEDPQQSYIAFGQKANFAGFDGRTNQPAVGFNVDMAVLEPEAVERQVLSIQADWSAAPRQVAVGLAQLCPDRAHIGWNMDPAGLPQPDQASLALKVRSGERLGQTINVDDGDGDGGTESVRTDEVRLDARIDHLPALMDFIAMRDTMSLTRSTQAVPDVTLDRFHMADDDPARNDDRPMFTTGRLTGLPRHVLLRTDRDATTGALGRTELTSWNLACPGQPTPPGDPAPDDVRRPDLNADTLPLSPAGCQRHNLAPIPTAEVKVQNWLPEDVDAVAATADLRPAPDGGDQYGWFASRTVNPLGPASLYAFGARVNGVQRGTVDLTGAAPGGQKTRVYLGRAPDATAGDTARFVVDVDGRTSTDSALNTGSRVSVDATIADLPDNLRIDAESTEGSPVDVTWRADAPFGELKGTVDAQFAAPEAFILRGAFETGGFGDYPLAPAGQVQVTTDTSGGAFHFRTPGDPTDGFPSPVVPPIRPGDPNRLHAGVELTSASDRANDLGTRLHAEVGAPQPTDIEWNTGEDGRLNSVVGNLCNPADRVICYGSWFDATAVRGPRTPTEVGDLLTAPALPAPTAPVSEAIPAFTEFRPDQGAKAVILGPDSWGADAFVRGITQFFFHREPLDVGVQVANVAQQPFRVNLLDASETVDNGNGPRPQVMFADVGIDRLPDNIRIRQQGMGSASDQPWLWVNTEDVTIENINDVNFAEDPADSRPRLTGVLRLGDAEVLRDQLHFDARPTPIRDGSTSGADVWADYDLDQSLLALDATASVEVPRHVALWRPTLARCDNRAEDASYCQTKPLYEIDKRSVVSVQFKTTSHDFGDVNAKADIHGEGLDWTVDARVEHVPGSLLAGVSVVDNQRLPWIDVRLDFMANAPLGNLRASVFDHNLPVEYRQSGDPDGEGQCTEEDDRCTANYAVDLANVADNLHVAARIQGAEETRLEPELEEVEETETSVGGIGYVHAVLDLGGFARFLTIDGREAADGQFVGTLSATGYDEVPAPVSGFLNARVEHITVGRDTSADAADPFEDFVIDGAGIIGAASGSVALGRVFQVLALPLDFLVGLFLELLFEGDLSTRFEVDMDLPLLVAFDRVDTIRFGMSGPTLSIDERHPGEGAPATIATRQQSLPTEEALTLDGAFFHRRDVRFVFDPILEAFDVRNSTTGTLQDVGLFRHRQCQVQDEDHICYNLARNEARLDQVARDTPREAGFTSGDALLDFLFTQGNRDELTDENDGFVEPGVEFYKTFAGVSPPVDAGAFFVPELAREPVAITEATFGERVVCCNTATFTDPLDPLLPGIEFNFGGVCDISTVDGVLDGPRAMGTDGTEYVVLRVRSNAVPESADRTLCDATRLVLEAHHQPNPAGDPDALGQVRWSVALPTPASLGPRGECRVEGMRCELATTVRPQVDGSVQVETVVTRFENGVNPVSIDTSVAGLLDPLSDAGKRSGIRVCCRAPAIQNGTELAGGTSRAWVDASGHPGYHREEATRVDGFDPYVVDADAAGVAEVDPCAFATFGCGVLPEDQTAQWLFGDGTKSDRLGGALDVARHRYPHSPADDPQLGMLVRFDADGEVVEKAYFLVRT